MSMSKLLLGGITVFALNHLALGANVVCAPTAVNSAIHAEGAAERLGDIVLSCTGNPGDQIGANLNLFLNANVTNRITGTNNLDVIFTIDQGAGPTSAGLTAQLVAVNQVAFNGVSFTVPASGRVSIRISNLRGNAIQLNGISPAVVNLSTTGQGMTFTNSLVTVGTPRRSLVGNVLSPLVCSQVGSPLPDTPGFSALLAAGSRFSSARVTEDEPTAFRPREAFEDSGVRIMSRYSGFPRGARLFVPD